MSNDAINRDIEMAVEKIWAMTLPENFIFSLKVEPDGDRWFVGGTYEGEDSLPKESRVFSFDCDFMAKEDAEKCKEAVYAALIERDGTPNVRITL